MYALIAAGISLLGILIKAWMSSSDATDAKKAALAKSLQDTLDHVKRADEARRSIDSAVKSGGLRNDDGFRRD